MRRLLQLSCLAIFVICPGLIGCRPKETELPFETIEHRESAGVIWEAKEPELMIMSTPEDLAQINDLFTKDAQAQLRAMDFDTYFAIASFLGRQGDSHEGIQIERAVRRGDAISVYVHVGKPGMFEIVSSPYHLVKVRKEGTWDRKIEFELFLDGTSATSVSHFVP
jgi:hypothetical protein